jgi:hypothetical protein
MTNSHRIETLALISCLFITSCKKPTATASPEVQAQLSSNQKQLIERPSVQRSLEPNEVPVPSNPLPKYVRPGQRFFNPDSGDRIEIISTDEIELHNASGNPARGNMVGRYSITQSQSGSQKIRTVITTNGEARATYLTLKDEYLAMESDDEKLTLAVFYPAYSLLEARMINRGNRLGSACKNYVSDYSGKHPNDIGDLYPDYMFDLDCYQLENFPGQPPRGSAVDDTRAFIRKWSDFEAAEADTGGGAKSVVIRSKVTTEDGRQLLIFADGHFNLVKKQ